MAIPRGPNQRRSLLFVSDALDWGRRFRAPAVVDDFTRDALAPELDALIDARDRPAIIVCDNGTELTSRAILDWANRTRVERRCIAPGKPQQNALVQSLNALFRDERPNEEVIASLAEARAVIARWPHDYETARPHSAHAGLTPAEAHDRAAADRLRLTEVSADRPLPARHAKTYGNPELTP